MRLVEPVSSSSVGVPPVVTTLTASEKATEMEMESPALYVPSAVEEVTPLIVGATPSITRALLLAKEPEAPGDARVRVALLPALSLMVPLFSERADVEV